MASLLPVALCACQEHPPVLDEQGARELVSALEGHWMMESRAWTDCGEKLVFNPFIGATEWAADDLTVTVSKYDEVLLNVEAVDRLTLMAIESDTVYGCTIKALTTVQISNPIDNRMSGVLEIVYSRGTGATCEKLAGEFPETCTNTIRWDSYAMGGH